MTILNRKKKVKSLLDKISKLVSAGFAYDSNFKNEIIILLKVVDKLSIEKLDFHLNSLNTMVNKRLLNKR